MAGARGLSSAEQLGPCADGPLGAWGPGSPASSWRTFSSMVLYACRAAIVSSTILWNWSLGRRAQVTSPDHGGYRSPENHTGAHPREVGCYHLGCCSERRAGAWGASVTALSQELNSESHFLPCWGVALVGAGCGPSPLSHVRPQAVPAGGSPCPLTCAPS